MLTKKMKVYFSSGVHSNLDSKRGIGANTQELIKELSKIKNLRVVDRQSEADIIHFTKFNPFFIAIPFSKPKKQKWVLTIHDLIPLIYPKHYPPGIKGGIRFLINKFLIWRYVDVILTISETSKKDIVRFLNINPDKVVVTYIAPKSAVKKLKKGTFEKETIKKFNLPEKFILFDHGVNYNKNLITLIKASIKIDMPVAIVGKEIENLGKFNLGNKDVLSGPLDKIRNLFGIQHPQLLHLKSLEKVLDRSKALRLGYVSDEDLNKLFNLATICVQPSYYEGFGMPPIEAMKVGCPVICSKTQALVEVAGDACLYFDPSSSDELADKIKILVKDIKLKNELLEKGYIRAGKYSWQKCANQTAKVYSNLLNY